MSPVVEVRVVVPIVWTFTVAGTTLLCAAAETTSLPLGKDGGMSPYAPISLRRSPLWPTNAAPDADVCGPKCGLAGCGATCSA